MSGIEIKEAVLRRIINNNMQRTVILVDRTTNDIAGCINTYLDSLDALVYNRTTHALMTVPAEHPVFHEQLCWHAPRREVFGALWDRQLQRKPRATP